MTSTPFYWVDAFTDRAFGGNPAAVCPLQQWLPDDHLKRMASQHGLSETAFFVPQKEGVYQLRWFTPDFCEVDLCGHATLAAAHVLMNERGAGDRIDFASRSGPLTVTRDSSGRLNLDFPSRPPQPITVDQGPPDMLAALGISHVEWIGLARDVLIVLPNETEVARLCPDFVRLGACDAFAFSVTAPGDTCDFVSRFFAPGSGIDEDPVTGSAHCTLIPYWAERLGKATLNARQISKRGGSLWCEHRGDRVSIAGNAVTYIRGQLTF